MLKVAATVEEQRKELEPAKKRTSYKDEVLPQQFKDGSVKKLELLAVFPSLSETYDNVKLILDQMDIAAVEFIVAADIKMLLMLIGKPEGKPKYNCPFCDGCAPFLEASSLYTFGDLFSWHQKYVDAGSPKKEQKCFQNIVNCPLITGPWDSLVLDKLNCPGLHILLGVVDKLF